MSEYCYQELSNGETISYQITNKEYQDVILLIHGNLSEKSSWARLITELSKHPYKIIAIDQRGFGNSTYNSKISKIEDLSFDLKDFCNHLQLQDLIICGWSLGGAVTLQFIAENPNLVKRAVLIASGHVEGYPLMIQDNKQSSQTQYQQINHYPVPSNQQNDNSQNNTQTQNQENPAIKQEEILRRVNSIEETSLHPKILQFKQILSAKDKSTFKFISTKVLFNGLYQPIDDCQELDNFIQGALKQQNYTEIAFALSQFNITASGTNLIEKISCPVLIYHGAKDLVIPSSNAVSNADYLGKDKCKLIIREDVGHCPPYDCASDLAQEIISFCK